MKYLLSLLMMCAAASAGDWTNSGGNQGRNGLSDEYGPVAMDLLWSGGRTSLISWQPVVEGGRVFVVRQAGWPGSTGDAPVVCMDLETGAEIWAVDIPFETGDWITWIAGVENGLVYASRSGNGASVSARLHALDAADGGTVWVSDDEIDAGPYDGVVFAPDGDPIIASFTDIWRIESTDGSTVWHSARTGSVSGQCGGCLAGDAFYVVDAVGGGHSIVRYDVETGAEMYSSPVMPGFTAQCTPMAGPDGTVYFNRSQTNEAVDFFYAFEDTGTGFTERWHIPTVNACAPEFGAGPDGSIYFVIPGPRLARVDPDDGSIIDQTDVLSSYTAARLAIDAAGTVYFSNGGFASGRFYAFSPDLAPLWDTPVTNINIGGPAIGQNGTVVICGVGTDVRAYRTGPGGTGDGMPVQAVTVSATPNPFSSTVGICIGLPGESDVAASIHDASGRLVRVLATGGSLPQGEHQLVWDGSDGSGAPVPPGTYLYRVVIGGESYSGRMARI